MLDLRAARRLVAAMALAAVDLHRDQLALEPMLDEVAATIGTEQRAAVSLIVSARRHLERLATDLGSRLSLIESTRVDVAAVDRLTATLGTWDVTLTDGERHALQGQRSAHIVRLVGGDAVAAALVGKAIDRGLSISDALTTAQQEMDAAARAEARLAAVVAELGLDVEGAAAAIARLDRNLAMLEATGHPAEIAMAAAGLVERFGLDLPTAVARSEQAELPLLDVIGEMLTAGALGITLVEFDALDGLRANFAAFDNATGGSADRRVSVGDLEYVAGHPWHFTPGQVFAAQALLDQPGLRHRLDTADENTDILGGAGFGSTEPGDGLIAERDLEAFLFKAQLRHLLGPFADEIDVANDPSGERDGFFSKNDFRAFVDAHPDLPEPVVVAAETMIANGWFDESWWQEHKDELAMGAALLAGGIVVVATAGGASVVLVAGAGALAAGGATIAVNLTSDDDLLDDVVGNAFAGLFVGAGVHTTAAGLGSYSAATTGLGRASAVASVAAGTGDAVSLGGIDLVIPEEHEDVVHDVAGNIGTAADTVNGSGVFPAE